MYECRICGFYSHYGKILICEKISKLLFVFVWFFFPSLKSRPLIGDNRLAFFFNPVWKLTLNRVQISAWVIAINVFPRLFPKKYREKTTTQTSAALFIIKNVLYIYICKGTMYTWLITFWCWLWWNVTLFGRKMLFIGKQQT